MSYWCVALRSDPGIFDHNRNLMRPILFTLLALSLGVSGLNAQKYFTRDGKISFYSEAPLENIEAHNSSATSVIDLDNGQMEFAILIKAFQFRKALMQEHFNENYMESNTYPKAEFKGAIKDFESTAILTEGEHPVVVEGEMTIHGVTRPLTATGKIMVKDGRISASSTFPVHVADYEIKIPGLMREKIAETVSVSVELEFEEFNPDK